MKKKLFLSLVMVIAFALAFCLAVAAKEYSPATSQELTEALAEINASSEDNIINLGGSYLDSYTDAGYQIATSKRLTVNLLSDTQVGCRFNVTGATTLIFNLNGHTLNNTKSRGGDVGSQFVLNNAGAAFEAYNGAIEINDVCFWFYNGSIKCDNVTIVANEETVWSGGSGGVGGVTFTGCDVTSGGDGTFMLKNGTCGGTNTRAFTFIDSTFTAQKGTAIQCPATTSVIRNCTFNGGLKLDTWCTHGDTKQSPVIIENVNIPSGGLQSLGSKEHYTVKNSNLGSVYVNGDNSGGTYLTVCDCEYSSVSFGTTKASQSGIIAITSPTCTENGVKRDYIAGDTVGVIDSEYSAPSLGHGFDENSITGVIYESYAQNGVYTSNCIRCDAQNVSEDKGTASALFELLGYSTDREGTRLVAGYMVNEEAYSTYAELTGTELVYGVVAYIPNEGEASCNPLVAQNGELALADKDYTIHADLTENECKVFDFVITGFDSTQSVTLAMCAYAFDGEKVVYLCSESGALVQYESAQAVTVYNGTVVKA